jgi:hypothetical protein
MPGVDKVDARTDRVVQGAVGVILLGAFVFRFGWLVPALGLVLAPGAIAGPGMQPLIQGFDRFVAPRLPAGEAAVIPASTVRAQDILTVAGIALASVIIAVGVGLLGWLVVIALAVVALIAATTRLHLGERLLRRFDLGDGPGKL